MPLGQPFTRHPLRLALAASLAVVLLAAPSAAARGWLRPFDRGPDPAASPSPSTAAAECDAATADPYAEFSIDADPRPRVWLEVATTPEQRQRGLMFRESMPWESGMLFEFPTPSLGGFWMRNTLIPLSIAWIDRDGLIVDIQDMQPLSDDVHAPSDFYTYALEVNQGWFLANGIGAGHRVLLCNATQSG